MIIASVERSLFTHGPQRWNCGSSDGLFILLLLLPTSNFWMLGTGVQVLATHLWTVGGWGGGVGGGGGAVL